MVVFLKKFNPLYEYIVSQIKTFSFVFLYKFTYNQNLIKNVLSYYNFTCLTLNNNVIDK